MCCSVLQCVAVCCSVAHRAAVCCGVFHSGAVSCNAMQCDAGCCNVLGRREWVRMCGKNECLAHIPKMLVLSFFNLRVFIKE